MIEDHVKELINLSLDGELTHQQAEELERHLQASQEAREYHTGLADLNTILEAAPEQTPPPELHDQIMQSIELPKAKPSLWTAIGRWINPVEWTGALRYGTATAAGLLIAVLVYENQPQIDGLQNSDQMVGSLVPARDAAQMQVIDELSFDAEGLAGVASIEKRDGVLVLDVQMEAGTPVDIAVSVLDGNLYFDALAQSQNTLESFEFADQQIRARGRGRQRFAVLLGRRLDSDSDSDNVISPVIQLQYRRGNQLIHEGELKAGQ